MVKHVILFLHETDLYRQDINILFDFLAQSIDIVYTGGVLLCGDDNLRRLHRSKSVVDELDVLLVKLMMVSKGKRRKVRGIRRKVVFQLLWRCNACQQQHMCVVQVDYVSH